MRVRLTGEQVRRIKAIQREHGIAKFIDAMNAAIVYASGDVYGAQERAQAEHTEKRQAAWDKRVRDQRGTPSASEIPKPAPARRRTRPKIPRAAAPPPAPTPAPPAPTPAPPVDGPGNEPTKDNAPPAESPGNATTKDNPGATEDTQP